VGSVPLVDNKTGIEVMSNITTEIEETADTWDASYEYLQDLIKDYLHALAKRAQEMRITDSDAQYKVIYNMIPLKDFPDEYKFYPAKIEDISIVNPWNWAMTHYTMWYNQNRPLEEQLIFNTEFYDVRNLEDLDMLKNPAVRTVRISCRAYHPQTCLNKKQ